MASGQPERSGLDFWRKARIKTLISKRYAIFNMDSESDEQQPLQNGFASCFIDDSDTDFEIALEESEAHTQTTKEFARAGFDKDGQRHSRAFHRSRSRSSSMGHKSTTGDSFRNKESKEPVGVTLSEDFQEESAFDDIDGADFSIKSGDKVDGDVGLRSEGVENSHHNGLDLGNINISTSLRNDGSGLQTDHTDQGLGRGDPQIMKDRNNLYQTHFSQFPPQHIKRRFEPTVVFNWFDMLIGICAIVIFFVDIGTDIELAHHYLKKEMWVYGGVTLGWIVGPSLITCLLGLHWYLIDYRKEREIVGRLKKAKKKAYKTPSHVWFLRVLFTAFQLGPVVRITEYLYCGVQSRNKKLTERQRKRYYRFMLYEDVDSCLLRLFESFLEAAPQLTWQLYIVMVLKPKEDVVGASFRYAALLSSWGALAISLVSYSKSLRNSHEEKAKMSIASLPFYFLWRASEVGGRVLCISMFMSVFKLWVLGPIAFHWVFISGWLMMQKTSFYKNKCLERVFNVVCGYVMVFCFLNLREGRTRFRFLLFYFIFYVENFFMLVFWFLFTPDLGAWFHIWGFVLVLVLFVFHLVFQLLYYAFFHPTGNIEWCVPCDPYIVYSSICYDVVPGLDEMGGQPNQVYAMSEMIVEPAQSRHTNDPRGDLHGLEHTQPRQRGDLSTNVKLDGKGDIHSHDSPGLQTNHQDVKMEHFSNLRETDL